MAIKTCLATVATLRGVVTVAGWSYVPGWGRYTHHTHICCAATQPYDVLIYEHMAVFMLSRKVRK
jgi:hypothetical protein